MINMNYAKLQNGLPVYLKMPLVLEADLEINGVVHQAGTTFCTNVEEVILGFGYKHVVREEMPVKEGFTYTENWIETDTTITRSWTEHEIPPTEYELYYNAVSSELGETE